MQLLGLTIWAALAVLVDVSLARMAFGAVVPSLRNDLGIDLSGAGMVSSANAVGLLITSIAAPLIGARLGLRRMAVLAHLVAALGFVLSGFTTSLAMLIAMRVVSGLGKARDSLQPSASPSIAPALNCAHASRRTCGVAAD